MSRSPGGRVSLRAEIFGQILFHLRCSFERYRVQMLVKFGHQPDSHHAEFLRPSGLQQDSRCVAARRWLKSVATVSASISAILSTPHGMNNSYQAGVGSWMVKLDAVPEGGIEFDNKFFMQPDDYRIHQIQLEGRDSSSDWFCYP
jgi:hypothetical protein